jgi:hypothetical protein
LAAGEASTEPNEQRRYELYPRAQQSRSSIKAPEVADARLQLVFSDLAKPVVEDRDRQPGAAAIGCDRPSRVVCLERLGEPVCGAVA